jgi:ATP-dependent protease ClpP protease subunit
MENITMKKKIIKKRVAKSKTSITRKKASSGKTKRVVKNPENQKKTTERKIGLSLNWKRSIHINKPINDVLLNELTPIILQMKQESSEPITVGIDSPGGNITSMEAILGLLKSPDQDGNKTEFFTAVTNRAFSAAASFLAFGDYSVSFSHSRILYHDVRYSGIEDVTPTKALRTARELERGNTAFSLKLADHIIKRFIWVYLDLKPTFDKWRKRYASFMEPYDESFKEVLPKGEKQTVDVVALALALYSKLSRPADNEIAIKALELLDSWIQIERIEKRLSKNDSKNKKKLNLLAGISTLIADIQKMKKNSLQSKNIKRDTESGLNKTTSNDVELLLEVVARRFATNKSFNLDNNGLDEIMEDFSFIKDMKSDKHINVITNMMIQHDHVFFGRSIEQEIKNAKDEEERNKILEPVYPQARIFWYYIVLICRCLCKGEHYLTPYDAQLIGLVDEVLGGGHIESRREFRKNNPSYE